MLCTRSRLAACLLVAVCSPAAFAWHDDGHARVARAAVGLLPDSVPAFFRDGGDTVAHLSIDPDVFKHPATPQLDHTEAPEHYIDLELLDGAALPATRYEFLQWCVDNNVDPRRVGLAPYAITEWTQKLTLAFAEYRKWPGDPAIQAKCRVYAGILCHYSADLCMPLHTTVHYDGRVGPDGRSSGSGIHGKVDALIAKLDFENRFAEVAATIEPFGDLFDAVLAELASSHALVDRVYELEPRLPQIADPQVTDEQVIAFGTDRAAASARFTARLFITAWEQSAGIELPPWLERPPVMPSSR